MENANPVKELLREKYFRETGPPEGIFQEKKLNLCLCFRLGTAPRILTKHPKTPISLMGGGGGEGEGGGQWKKCFWEGHSYLHTSKPDFCNEQREI